MAHAAAAAVLRNAYLTRSGQDGARYAIDLSSQRVRTALWLLDTVRQGQPLGAVLGYRFERGLHEGHLPLRLDRYVEPFRRLFPAESNDGADSSLPAEAVAPRAVVDGLRLRAAWLAGTIPFASNPDLPASGADRQAIEAELRALDDALDAVADLLTAESVYQIVRGNWDGAAASLDALARGTRPPEPEVAHQPRGGTTLTHRVAVVLGGDPMPPGPFWPAQPTPRAQAEPYLDGWTGTLLGDPRAVSCRVGYRDSAAADPGQPLERLVTLADLGLRPLDVLALARGASAGAGGLELDWRVADAVLQAVPGAVEIRITYAPAAGTDRTRARTFPEIVELARAIDGVLDGARPLGPADLLPPETAAAAQSADRLPAEALARATAARTALAAAADGLDAAAAAVAAAGDALALTPLREALRQAALFGVANAIPAADGASATLRVDLLSQAATASAELRRRSAPAAASEDPVAIIRAVFGPDFVFLPRFTPVGGTDLGAALAAGPAVAGEPTVTRKWFQQAARVRAPLGRWRKLSLYAEALGAPAARFDVAQLPHVDGERWVALPFAGEADRPPSGRISLVLHRPVASATDAAWVGLVLDEWTELIPGRTELTGLAFHYDDPRAEAPHAVLVAVPPDDAPSWDLEALVSILHETLDLAKLRAVDGQLLGSLGQVLPAIYLAANTANETVATDLSTAIVQDPQVVPPES
jgi:hypothetical protein